jgi:hypothetical protein
MYTCYKSLKAETEQEAKNKRKIIHFLISFYFYTEIKELSFIITTEF